MVPPIRHAWRLDEVLPHRPPMILLDEIVATDDTSITCNASIGDDHPFLRGGVVSPMVLLECMAQASGALLGVWTREADREVTGGLLLGSPEFELYVDALHVGDRLHVRSQHLWGTDDIWKFRCRAWRGDELLAEGVLNVLRVDFRRAQADLADEPSRRAKGWTA